MFFLEYLIKLVYPGFGFDLIMYSSFFIYVYKRNGAEIKSYDIHGNYFVFILFFFVFYINLLFIDKKKN